MENNNPSRTVLKDINNAGILIQQQQQQEQQQNLKNNTSPSVLNNATIDIENKPLRKKSIEDKIKSPTKINTVELKSPSKSLDINIDKDRQLQILLPDIVNVVPAITLSEPKTNQSYESGDFNQKLVIDTEKSFNEDEQEFLTPKLIITETSLNSSDDEIFTECHSSPQSDIESSLTTAANSNNNNNTTKSSVQFEEKSVEVLLHHNNTKSELDQYDDLQLNVENSINVENIRDDNNIDISHINNIFSTLNLNTSEIQTNSIDENLANNTNLLITTTQLNTALEIKNDSDLNILSVNDSSFENNINPEGQNNAETSNVNNFDLQKENYSSLSNNENMIPLSDNKKDIPVEISMLDDNVCDLKKDNSLIQCDIISENTATLSPSLNNDKISECGSEKLSELFDGITELNEDSFLENEKKALTATDENLPKNIASLGEHLQVSLNSSGFSGQNDVTIEVDKLGKSTEIIKKEEEQINQSTNCENNRACDLKVQSDKSNETVNLNDKSSIDCASNNDIQFTESHINSEIQTNPNDINLKQKENSPMVDSIENTLIKSVNSEMFDSLEQQKPMSRSPSNNNIINDNQIVTTSGTIDDTFDQLTFKSPNTKYDCINLNKSDNALFVTPTDLNLTKDVTRRSLTPTDLNLTKDITRRSVTPTDLNLTKDITRRSITPTDLNLTKDITRRSITPTDLNLTKDITRRSISPTDLNLTKDITRRSISPTGLNLTKNIERRSITPPDLNLTKDITRSESIDEFNQTNDLGSVKGSFEVPIGHLKVFNSTVKIGGSDLNHTFNTNSQGSSAPNQNNQTFTGDFGEPMDVDLDSNLNFTDDMRKSSMDEDMFRIPKNISNGRKSLQMVKEEFNSNGMILNPSDFEFLLAKGSNDIIPDNRNSLLLKFDPLVGRPVLANQVQQSQEAQILKKHNQSFPQVQETEKEFQTSNKLLNLSIGETTREKNSSIESLKQKAAEKIHQLIFDKKGNDKMSVDVIQDLNITSDIKSINSIKNSKQINDKTLLKMEEIEIKVQNEVGKTEDLEKKLKESEQREEALLKRITEKEKTFAKLTSVIEEYEKAIAEAIAEKEHLTQDYEKQLQEIKNDRDLNYQHLASLESTFADLHLKYERSKQTMAKLRVSEQELLAEKKQNLENLHLQEQRYEKMKNHAMQQLDIANNKLEFLTKNHAMEITKIKALLKKEEISKASVSEQLQQKSRENEELMKICDELINGGQNS